MLYRLAKIIMTIALRLFYRRIYVTGLEVIPTKGPAIILANHPSSLMDAALIGLLAKRPVHFFTRGDVFINKPVHIILSKLRMIPVYNHEGGRNTREHNDESFKKAEKILSAGGVILFFPEGNSKTGHKLMPLRKGVFRMAFQAAVKNNFSYDIPFIPAGVNYEHPIFSDTDVMVHFGKPFFLSDYRKEYEVNPAAALLQMTKDGFNAIEKRVLHINDAAHFSLAEKCLTIERNNYSFFTGSWLQATIKRFDLEKNICNRINSMKEEARGDLQLAADNYFNKLREYKLRDRTLSSSFSFTHLTKWRLILTVPLFIIGWLLNALPVLIAKRIADKKVTRPDFYSWIFVTVSAVLYILWILMLFTGFLIIGWKYAVAVVLAAIASGIFLYHYTKGWNMYKQFRRLRNLAPETVSDLLSLRASLYNFINNAGIK